MVITHVRFSVETIHIRLRFDFFFFLAAQEGREGLVQTAPEDPKEKRRRIRWQSQEEG